MKSDWSFRTTIGKVGRRRECDVKMVVTMENNSP